MTAATTTVCPHCGRAHQHRAGVNGAVSPSVGDFTVCLDCTQWSVYAGAGTLRKPSPAEEGMIAADPQCVRVAKSLKKSDVCALCIAPDLDVEEKDQIHVLLYVLGFMAGALTDGAPLGHGMCARHALFSRTQAESVRTQMGSLAEALFRARKEGPN